MLLHISAEEEVLPPALLHHIIKPGLIYGKVIAVPRIDSWSGDIHHHHLDLRTLQGNHSHGWPTNITGSDAANFHHFLFLSNSLRNKNTQCSRLKITHKQCKFQTHSKNVLHHNSTR
ncbi:hypothetical protein V8G54_017551 [Vigna mungo]|uniref:Uncharacterized protein n=1 Tax=Vigna mungo TaxID=3915 RepID=A0AAQ3S256_VIGMU